MWKILQIQITIMQICNDFELKNLCEYQDLYLMLLLADVFKNFRKLCFKIFHLDPANFL